MSTETHPSENLTQEPAIKEDLVSVPAGRNGKPLGGRFVYATANYIDERESITRRLAS